MSARNAESWTTAAIVRLLDEADADIVVVVSCLDRGQLDPWPDRTSDNVVITGRAWQHMHSQHRELADFKLSVIEALRAPELIYEDGRPANPNSAQFVRPMSAFHDLVVPVAIVHDVRRMNSAITAHIQRRKRRRKMDLIHVKAWWKQQG